MRGNVFDIKRFTIHDGPGIRTTIFTKGCPLDCLWCQNPEGRVNRLELRYFANKCIKCDICIKACLYEVLSIDPDTGSVRMEHDKCRYCSKCIEKCPSGALLYDGREMESSEVVTELLKDKIFYLSSDGGITVSGGEPTAQYAFNLEILKACKDEGIHTAIETCLHVETGILEKFLSVTDLFITDIKLYQSELHRKYTGLGNELIKRNLEMLIGAGANILVRVPLIPGYTSDENNLRSIADYIRTVGTNLPVELLNYNQLAENKYRLMEKEFKPGLQLKPYNHFEMEGFKALFKSSGITNIVEN